MSTFSGDGLSKLLGDYGAEQRTGRLHRVVITSETYSSPPFARVGGPETSWLLVDKRAPCVHCGDPTHLRRSVGDYEPVHLRCRTGPDSFDERHDYRPADDLNANARDKARRRRVVVWQGTVRRAPSLARNATADEVRAHVDATQTAYLAAFHGCTLDVAQRIRARPTGPARLAPLSATWPLSARG